MSKSDNEYRNEVALITGANQGIGLQIARELAARGMTVLVGARAYLEGEAAAKTIAGDARALQLDVALWGSSARALLAELASVESAESRVARITRAFEEQLPRSSESASGRLARRAVQLIEQGESRVEAVATRLGVTARYLRRAFTEAVVVGPKESRAEPHDDFAGLGAHRPRRGLLRPSAPGRGIS